MKINRIDLRNFRQFYGHQFLELATDMEKNVTLIHAENGIGKTTLLNSVYWALFGEVTPRFEQRKRLLNFEAEREGLDEASVEVEFEFDGVNYHASRRHAKESGAETFAISKLDAGAMRPLIAPETFVNSVIPKEMAKYFFFDGEHAESFAAEQNTTAGAAIRSMLGCDLAELGISDLEEVSAQYTRQIGSVQGDAALDSLKSKLAQMETARAKTKLKLAEEMKAVDLMREQRDLIEEQLRRTAGAKEIQELRDTLEQNLRDVVNTLSDEERKRIKWIGEKGLAVISRKVTDVTAALINSESAHGRIPKPYNEVFIQGLLSKELCICCRALRPETKEWAAVTTLLNDAGNADTMSRVIRAAARLQQLKQEAQEAPRTLKAIQAGIAMLVGRRREIEQRLDQENRKLENFDLNEVREREAARVALGKRIDDTHREIWSLERDIVRQNADVTDLGDQLEKHAAKNERARTILAKRSLALAAAQRLRSELKAYEEEARSDIQGEINKILTATARRDYRFEFDERFGMSLHQVGIAGPVPKSGGENQLMSLCFTAALVDFARSRLNKNHAVLSPGTVAPLVLDAPIGHLDKAYRSATAAFLPLMASQVLLLLSSGHSEGGVLEALRPRVGRQYILVSDNRAAREGRGEDAISINGRQYCRSIFGQERDQTRIVEVR